VGQIFSGKVAQTARATSAVVRPIADESKVCAFWLVQAGSRPRPRSFHPLFAASANAGNADAGRRTAVCGVLGDAPAAKRGNDRAPCAHVSITLATSYRSTVGAPLALRSSANCARSSFARSSLSRSASSLSQRNDRHRLARLALDEEIGALEAAHLSQGILRHTRRAGSCLVRTSLIAAYPAHIDTSESG
jgi:hypothetical protein